MKSPTPPCIILLRPMPKSRRGLSSEATKPVFSSSGGLGGLLLPAPACALTSNRGRCRRRTRRLPACRQGAPGRAQGPRSLCGPNCCITALFGPEPSAEGVLSELHKLITSRVHTWTPKRVLTQESRARGAPDSGESQGKWSGDSRGCPAAILAKSAHPQLQQSFLRFDTPDQTQFHVSRYCPARAAMAPTRVVFTDLDGTIIHYPDPAKLPEDSELIRCGVEQRRKHLESLRGA